MTLLDLVGDHARRRPGAVALIDGEKRRKWRDLEARSDRLASVLRRLGVRAGDRVGILAANCCEWVEAFLGIQKARAVPVPINERLNRAECDRLLDDAGAAALLLAPDLATNTSFAGPSLTFRSSYEAAIADAPEGKLGEPAPQGDDLAAIAYTSGTTGLPKGVMWSHRTLATSVLCTPFTASVAGGARILLCAPISAAGGLVMAANALAIGATLVMVQFTPALVLRTMVEAQIEFTGMVPVMIALLLDEMPPGWRAPALRRIFYGTAPISPQLFARAREVFGCEFEQAYGMTETCTFGTRLDPADHLAEAPERLASAGRPMPGVALKIVDEAGAEVPPGTEGEVLIRSPGNMLGYWQRPEESRRALAEGWYHTNDIGYLDSAGYLYLRGRSDDMIKSGGFNVWPAEVEDVLVKHPAVEEAAVIGLSDERWGQRLAAVVRKREGASLEEPDLIDLCRGALAGYKIPRTVIFRAEPLPRNALAKVSRQALKAQYDRGSSSTCSAT